MQISQMIYEVFTLDGDQNHPDLIKDHMEIGNQHKLLYSVEKNEALD